MMLSCAAAALVTVALCGQIEAGATRDKIAELGWFVGRWQVAGHVGGEKFQGELTCTWINNENFLLQRLSIPARRVDYTEIVGWDPARQTIASWGFGTYGGHGQLLWQKQPQENPIWNAKTVGPWTAWDGTRLTYERTWRIEAADRFTFEELVRPEGEDVATLLQYTAQRKTP